MDIESDIELKEQKKELEEEIVPIIELSKKGKLSYDEFIDKLIQAFERAKEKYCRRHGITREEYDREQYIEN